MGYDPPKWRVIAHRLGDPHRSTINTRISHVHTTHDPTEGVRRSWHSTFTTNQAVPIYPRRTTLLRVLCCCIPIPANHPRGRRRKDERTLEPLDWIFHPCARYRLARGRGSFFFFFVFLRAPGPNGDSWLFSCYIWYLVYYVWYVQQHSSASPKHAPHRMKLGPQP